MRKISVFTGTRAEYGLLKPLLIKMREDPNIELQLVVSGTHLSPEFGLTYHEIENDGFPVNETIEMLLSSDTPVGLSKSVGLGVTGYAEVLQRLSPDMVVLLGDRFEALAFAIAAMIARCPIVHIAGGEATFGLIDEAIRHAITKMSHLHFVSTEVYRRRVIQLGESPERVFNVGSLSLDAIRTMPLLSQTELEQDLGICFAPRNLLVTFHSVTLEKNTAEKQFQELLNALTTCDETLIIFTKANADTDGRVINSMIDAYVQQRPKSAVAFSSLGQCRYLSMLQVVDAVVGNSSSGLIEPIYFRKGTINIGDRQKGRIKPGHVIDCEPLQGAIIAACEQLYSRRFQQSLHNIEHPYGDGEAAQRILAMLKQYPTEDLLKKVFYDIA